MAELPRKMSVSVTDAIEEVKRLRAGAVAAYADLIQPSPSSKYVSATVDAYDKTITALSALQAKAGGSEQESCWQDRALLEIFQLLSDAGGYKHPDRKVREAFNTALLSISTGRAATTPAVVEAPEDEKSLPCGHPAYMRTRDGIHHCEQYTDGLKVKSAPPAQQSPRVCVRCGHQPCMCSPES